MHLNFGYHVEHHLFPSMNPRHAKAVHRLLKKHYPDTYQVMPKWQAMKELYRTARIYKNHNELIHPLSLEVFATLGPQVEVSIDSSLQENFQTKNLISAESTPTDSLVILSEDPQATPSLI